MRLRALGLFQLCAVLVGLTAACSRPSEDTSCPAMDRALEAAANDGVLEPLPLSAEGGGYKIVLESRETARGCDVSYQFRISGVSAADYESGQFDRFICGPGPITTSDFSMDDGDLLMDAQVSQWQPTGVMRVTVGSDSCSGAALVFTHVGRIA